MSNGRAAVPVVICRADNQVTGDPLWTGSQPRIARGDGWRTALDALFAAILALMLLARWVAERSGEATTRIGEPAPPQHCRRGSTVLFLGAPAPWVVANMLGNHVLA